MKKLLTIIIPVYKVEKYIRKCLDSLIIAEEQMQALEVIVVNDGTPDNSAVIAKEYEKKYPDIIRVIDKENGGHGSAWNKGLELATGKYIRFLDSDDWLTNLSEFITRLADYDVDMVFTDLLMVNEQGSKYDKLFQASIAMDANTVYDVNKYDWQKTNAVYYGVNVTNFHMCTYRTEMLKRHHPVFLEKVFYDDEILFVLPLCMSKSFVYIDVVLYNYLVGRTGQTVDPAVAVRNIDFYVRVRKNITEFYKSVQISQPSVKRKLEYVLNYKHRHTFLLMALLPYQETIRQTAELTRWIDSNYPEFRGGMAISIYNFSPSFFWGIYHYLRPLWSYLKVDILKLA